MTKQPSASALGRFAACPASFLLPQFELAPTKESTTGNGAHDWLDTGELPTDAASRAIVTQIERVLPVARNLWRHEVAFAYDCSRDEARILGERLKRNYSSALNHEVCGTADAVLFNESEGIVTVLELKTGWRTVTPDSWQLRFLALAAARAFECDRVDVLLLIAHEDDARVEPIRYDVIELASIATELHALMTRQQSTTPTPGEWCRYCPAMASCPSVTGILRALAVDTVKGKDFVQPLTPANVADVYHLAKAVKAGLLRIEEQLESWARQAPVPLGNGRFYGLRPSRQWEFDARASEALRAWLGDKANVAIVEKLSATSLAKAVGKGASQQWLARLEQQGLASQREMTRLREYSERESDD